MTQFACRKPTDVPGALIRKDHNKGSFAHNTKLMYTCQHDWIMKGGPAKRKCVNGTWTEVKFKCESKYIKFEQKRAYSLFIK